MVLKSIHTRELISAPVGPFGMSLISGDTDNFFSRMGDSVSIGDHCECLVKAAALVAFPSNENWKFLLNTVQDI